LAVEQLQVPTAGARQALGLRQKAEHLANVGIGLVEFRRVEIDGVLEMASFLVVVFVGGRYVVEQAGIQRHVVGDVEFLAVNPFQLMFE
jgi:hypothetical protein